MDPLLQIHNVAILNICMKEFGAKMLYKMTVMRTLIIFAISALMYSQNFQCDIFCIFYHIIEPRYVISNNVAF